METKTYIAAVRKAADFVRSKAPGFTPQVAVILGSGLAKAVPTLEKTTIIPYSDIPGFPRTTVAGHMGKLVLGQLQLVGDSSTFILGLPHVPKGNPPSGSSQARRFRRLFTSPPRWDRGRPNDGGVGTSVFASSA